MTTVATELAKILTKTNSIKTTRGSSADSQFFTKDITLGPLERLDLTIITPKGFYPRSKEYIVESGILRRVPSQYPTITAAVNSSSSGDVVLVADGIYHEGEIDPAGKAISIVSENGPSNCILDGEELYSACFRLTNYEDYGTVIKGFTMKNYGNGLLLRDAYPIVMDCMFLYNGLTIPNGGGIRAFTTPSLVVPSRFTNCVFAHNNTTDVGGAMYLARQDIVVSNCTVVYNNSQNTSFKGGGGICCLSILTTLTLFNSIVYFNTGQSTNIGTNQILTTDSTIVVSHCDVQRNPADPPWPGDNNIKVDPKIDSSFRLSPDSLCINSGTTATDYLSAYDIYGTRRVIGSNIDMGAYEHDGNLEPSLVRLKLNIGYLSGVPSLDLSLREDTMTLIIPGPSDIKPVRRSIPVDQLADVYYRVTSDPDISYMNVGTDVDGFGGSVGPSSVVLQRDLVLQRDSVYRLRLENPDGTNSANILFSAEFEPTIDDGEYKLT